MSLFSVTSSLAQLFQHFMLILVVSALLPQGRSCPVCESDSALLPTMVFSRVSPGLQEYFWTVSALGVSCKDAKKILNQCNTECIAFSLGSSLKPLLWILIEKKLKIEKKSSHLPGKEINISGSISAEHPLCIFTSNWTGSLHSD